MIIRLESTEKKDTALSSEHEPIINWQNEKAQLSKQSADHKSLPNLHLMPAEDSIVSKFNLQPDAGQKGQTMAR